MSYSRNADSRDRNEKEITAELRRRGLEYRSMPRGVGFDLLVFCPGGLVPVEVKNPARRWEYTESENAARILCHALGINYVVVFRAADCDEIRP